MALAPIDVSVVMVPLPAQGHLNQFLHLSRLLAARGLKVHYVGSATHNRQIRDRAMFYSDESTIQFHDIHLPPFASPPPDPNSKNNFPGHLQPAWEAALHLRSPLAAIISSLSSSSRRVTIIHDSTMSFPATAVASHPNVESFSFSPVSATASFLGHWEFHGKPPIQVIDQFDLDQASIVDRISEEFINFVRGQERSDDVDSGHLINTCRAIEGRFVDLLVEQPTWQNKTFAIGPLNPIFLNPQSSSRRHECLEWLDKQPPSSVVYVSFGTTCTLSDGQVAELAAGLEASGQRFIWVLRDADLADIYAAEAAGDEENKVKRRHHSLMPPSYLDRIHGRGMVVDGGWAPQLEILAHRSTGCFVSHCGWNSCIESLTMGVAILAWPMHSDQPANALLIANVLGAGLMVPEEKEVGVVSRSRVRDSIEIAMESEEGEKMRRRAREMGVEVRRAAMEGGTSYEELDAFVAHVSRD